MEFVPSAPVAVVIPVHNGMAHLPQTLDLLAGMQWDEAMVVVIDDGSTDGTGAYLESRPDVTVIPGSGDLWWTGAVEIGCSAAIRSGAEIIVLWNEDNLAASPELIARLVAVVREEGGCAAPVTVEDDAGELRVVTAGGDVDWLGGGLRLRQPGAPFRAEDEIDHCQWLGGTSLTFPARLFEAVRGFDARRFPQYRGDADFSLRAFRAGFPCSVLRDSYVVTDMNRTGLDFRRRVGLRQAIRGLVSLRSNYHVPSTIRFYWVHCPRRLFVPALANFYLRYCYAVAKTNLPGYAP